MAFLRTIRGLIRSVASGFTRRPDVTPAPEPPAVVVTEPVATPPVATRERVAEHPVRLRPPANGLLDNSDFFEQIRASATPVRTPDPDAPRYTLPTMKLPKPNKAAFNSEQLFAQQRNLPTFDYGLQGVLDALRGTINQFMRLDTPLSEFAFTMNFSGATSPDRKVFVANMRRPLQGTVELVQSIDAEMQTTWQLVVRGQLFTHVATGPNMNPDLIQFVRPPEPPMVLTDDTTENRAGRVIDFE